MFSLICHASLHSTINFQHLLSDGSKYDRTRGSGRKLEGLIKVCYAVVFARLVFIKAVFYFSVGVKGIHRFLQMADPLSVTSIVSTVEGISDSITRQIQEYRKWNTAARDGKAGVELVSELHSTQLVLDQLRQLESQTGFISNQNESSKARILSSLEGCQQVLKELEQRQGPGNRKMIRLRSLTSSIRQRDIEKFVQSLNIHQKKLQLLMTM